MAKFADHMEKITEGVTEGYKKIEGGVVEGFTGIVDKMSGVMLDEEGNLKTGKVGETVVGAYKKVEDAFVNTFMAKEGETVEEAKARVTAGTEARQAKIKADMEAREAAQKATIKKSLEASCTAFDKLRNENLSTEGVSHSFKSPSTSKNHNSRNHCLEAFGKRFHNALE